MYYASASLASEHGLCVWDALFIVDLFHVIMQGAHLQGHMLITCAKHEGKSPWPERQDLVDSFKSIYPSRGAGAGLAQLFYIYTAGL